MPRIMKCPSCGADLTIKNENRAFLFCEYCGTKIDLIDSRVEHHIVDEARIIEAETERQIKLKHLQMETEEYERRKAEKEKAAKKQAREHRREQEFDEANRKILLIIVGIFLLLIFSPLFSS